MHATSLALAVTGLLMPALFALGGRESFLQREVVSGTVAAVLIALYLAALAFTLITHQHLFRTPEEGEVAAWTKNRAIASLLGATALVALMSEFLVGSLEPALAKLGLSELFVGLIVIPIIGNAAEHSSAVMFALRNKLDVTLEIAIGSSARRSRCSWLRPWCSSRSLIGHPMDFVFRTSRWPRWPVDVADGVDLTGRREQLARRSAADAAPT